MNKKDINQTKNYNTENSKSIFTTLGASNHTDETREKDDYYATDPKAVDKLLSLYTITEHLYEPSCGEGHLSKRLKELGHTIYSTDLYNRGYGDKIGVDFLALESLDELNSNASNNIDFKDYSIITNPPYKYCKEFVLKALDLVNDGKQVIMFLKLQFLESKGRYKDLFSKYPPKEIFVFSERLLCAKNGDFQKMIDGGGSAIAYAWYVWEKGFKGTTRLRWI